MAKRAGRRGHLDASSRRVSLALLLMLLACLPASSCGDGDGGRTPPWEGRQVLSLDGTWEVGEGALTAEAPAELGHAVPVPALLSAASPRFEAIGSPRLRSPEDPCLYELHTSVREGAATTDERTTRFGMRSAEWRGGDAATRGFFLNGERYYLRGSNITLHRFFEDEAAGTLAWDESMTDASLGLGDIAGLRRRPSRA